MRNNQVCSEQGKLNIYPGKMVQNNITWFSTCALALLVLLINVPFIQRLLGGSLIIFPVIAIYALSCYKNRFVLAKHSISLLLCCGIYYLFVIIYKITGISSATFGHDIHTILYFVLFASVHTILNMDLKKRKFLLNVAIITMLITVFSNFIQFNKIGSSSYFLLHHIETDSALGNLATTQFSTGLVLLTGFLYIMFHTDSNKRRRMLWIILILICILFNILIAQRAINIILTAGMLVFLYIFKGKNKMSINILLIVSFILFVIIMQNITAVLSFFGNLLGSSRIAHRLNSLSTFLLTREAQEAGGSMSERFMFYNTSISTWLSSLRSFFFGVGDHIADNTIIGNHSQIFDVLAQYGIICALCFYYSVYKTLALLIEKLSIKKGTKIYRQTLVIFAVFLVRGFLGFVVYEQIAVSMFIFFPTMISLMNEGVNKA